jgi:hypothetical protein
MVIPGLIEEHQRHKNAPPGTQNFPQPGIELSRTSPSLSTKIWTSISDITSRPVCQRTIIIIIIVIIVVVVVLIKIKKISKDVSDLSCDAFLLHVNDFTISA